MTQNELKSKLKSSNIGGWYIFAGEEEYLKSYYRTQIKNIAAPDEAFALFNHTVYDGQEMTVASLSEAIKSPPMMSDYKLIEWRFADLEKMKASELSALEKLFAEKEDYPYAILLISALPTGFDTGTQKKPSKLYNKLSAGFDIIVFEKSTDAQLLSWMKKHFDAEGVAVDLPTLNTLLFRVGHSMQMLKNEITKLCAYAKANGKVSVNSADVTDICAATIECDAFAISNAIIEKNIEKAFLALADMKQQRVDAQAVLGQLSKTYSELLSISLLIDEGKDAKDIETIMKFHPYRLKLYIGAAKKLGSARICAALDSLVRIDSASKSGGIGGYKSIEIFITQNI